MKMRMIKLRPEFLMKILQGKTNSYASNLPDDTELLDVKYDLFSNQVLAIVRSNSFEDVPESHPIEEFNVIYTPEFSLAYSPRTKEPQPMNSKTRPIPAISLKPESQPTKEIRIQPSSDTSEVEEEFTPKQRKVKFHSKRRKRHSETNPVLKKRMGRH